MLKVLVGDDELKARTMLAYHLNRHMPGVTEIRVADSVENAIKVLQWFSPDLVFLDIEMPYQSGFDLLSIVREPTFEVIFTTAHNQYAIQAIRFSALDYLLKPIDPEDLVASIKRFIRKQTTVKNRQVLFDNLIRNIDRSEIRDFRLAVPSNDGIFFFTVPEIIRLEAKRNYTVIHIPNKRPYIASRTLKFYEDMLAPYKFVRTHKSHLVNSEHIVKMSSNHDFIYLQDGTKIIVSRRKKDEVQQILNVF